MDASPETLETLARCFLQTLSSDRQPWRQAEEYLASAAERPGYALAFLRLLSDASVPDQARLAASVAFKNHLRSRWRPAPDLATTAIADAEKEQIKILTVRVMLSSQPPIQGQLSESLAVISEFDFPRAWPGLLPELVASVRSAAAASDYAAVNCILATTASIFMKFRSRYLNIDFLLDLEYCLDGFAAPLLELFSHTGRIIDAAVAGSGGGDALLFRRWFESQRFCCRIFFSLNFRAYPEFPEDQMKEWMGEFLKYLTTAYPLLDNDESGGGREVADKLRKAVLKNVDHYMKKNAKEFRPFLSGFASAVWSLLVSVSAKPNCDKLTVAAIKFLTTIISSSVDHALFASPDTLRQICESIVTPNVRVREDDEQEFEMDYVEYIRRDIEGSDVDSRRRIVSELVKGLVRNYREQVWVLMSAEVHSMIEKYAANPVENWKDKDCAIFLVVSLADSDLMDVESFFKAVIDPELKCADVNSQPMLKADALKCFTTFRSRIPKNLALELFPHVIRFLTAESVVVHSYAADCIEKLLLVKDEGRAYTASDMSPFLIPLMTNLYHVLELPGSEENQYAMKCITRVFGVAELNADIAAACIAGLRTRLIEVCKNPKNPYFSYCLFESVAALLRRTCKEDPSLMRTFEASLLDILQKILLEDMTDFLPYALQIFAQMIDMNRPPLPATYMQLVGPLLSPELWVTRGNIPALVRLLQAYLQTAPMELEQRLNEVLGIVQKLIEFTRTENYGFDILRAVIENLIYDVVSTYVLHIWNALFTRLHTQQKSKRFAKSLLRFMSLFLVKHGHAALVNTINAVQENLFLVILEQFWIPNLKLIRGFIKVKLCLVASTRLLCESPSLLQDSPSILILWGKMLDSIVTLLSRWDRERMDDDDDEPEVPDMDEVFGDTDSFVKLQNAAKKEEDVVKDIKDPKEYVITSLARLSALSPGKFPAIIQGSLHATNQVALLQLCGMYGCSIV